MTYAVAISKDNPHKKIEIPETYAGKEVNEIRAFGNTEVTSSTIHYNHVPEK